MTNTDDKLSNQVMALARVAGVRISAYDHAKDYLRQLAPHVREREGAQIIEALLKEIGTVGDKQNQLQQWYLEWLHSEYTTDFSPQSLLEYLKARCCVTIF